MMFSFNSKEEFIRQKGIENRSILFCILDWGLGHATRSIPLIEALLNSGNSVIIASNGKSAILLKARFPNLVHEALDPFEIKYSESKYLFSAYMALQIPSFLKQIKKDKALTKSLIEKHQIDTVISDHRYGCYAENTVSYIICHQLQLPLKSSKLIAQNLHERELKAFDEIIVPDFFDERSLAGNLSKNDTLDMVKNYIGPLSRFEMVSSSEGVKSLEAVAIISGPEPLRSRFEKETIEKFKSNPENKFVLVRGLPSEKAESFVDGNVQIFSHLDDKSLIDIIKKSNTVISRSGYSSIMDYYFLKCKAIILPTPGQNEQEYLSEYWKNRSFKPA